MVETYFKEEAGWPPIRVLMPDDPVMGGLDGCDNAAPKALTQRSNQLRSELTAAVHSIERLHQRLEGLSSSDGPALEEALCALLEERYPYRYYETFAPGWTLIDTPNLAPLEIVTLTTPMPGDDSLDVSDTSSLQAGCCYVLFDGAARQEIEIKEILSQHRIRIEPALTIALTDKARLGRTDWTIAPRAASATIGSSYFTRTLDLGPSTGQRAILVRSSPTKAIIGCAFRAASGLWTECVWSWRRFGQSWQEIEFLLPSSGPTQLRVTVDGEAALRRIVVLEGPSGLGGTGNGPAQPTATPDAPMNRTPKPEEHAVALTGPLIASDFSMPTGTDIHEASQWQIASDQAFKEIVHDSGNSQQLTSYAIPAGTLKNLALYWFRVRFRGKTTGYGDWSSPTSFETVVNAAVHMLATPGRSAWTRPPEIHKWRVTVIGAGGRSGGNGGVSIREYRSSEGDTFTAVVASGNGETSSFGTTQYATGGGSLDGKGFGGDKHPAWSPAYTAISGIAYGKGEAGGFMNGSSVQGCILIEWGY